MPALERIEEVTANGVRAGAVVSTMSQAVDERECISHGSLLFKFEPWSKILILLDLVTSRADVSELAVGRVFAARHYTAPF